jgi:hypothetical protein
MEVEKRFEEENFSHSPQLLVNDMRRKCGERKNLAVEEL